MHTLMSHACAFQTQLAAATRLAHVPRALSESLDTPTCLSKKLASAQRPAPRGPTAGTSSDWTAPARRGCPSRTASRRYPRSRGDSLAPSRPRQRPEPLAPANCWDPVWAPQARRVAGTCPAHARRLRAGARSARRARRGSRVAACIAVAGAPRFPAARLSASAVLWAQELRSRGAVP